MDAKSSLSSLGPRLSRRQLLGAGSRLAILASLGGVAVACGGGEQEPSQTQKTSGATISEELSGRITMMNYPGWIGENEVVAFESEFSDVTVKQVAGLTSGNAAAAAQIRQNQDSYDMSLANLALAGQLDAGALLQELDVSRIPNVERIPESFRQAYPFGIPTDFGKTGFGYRKDLMTERPTSWADMWELAPKYSGQIVFVDFDTDIVGSALIYKGYSPNSVDPGELEVAKQALIEIKPHLHALLPTGVTKPMLQGTAVMTLTYDYDIALAARRDPNVVWVAPEEGLTGYLDGWIAIAGTDLLPEVSAFMNFHLEPEQYADFINTTGSSYAMPDAEPYIDEAIVSNPSLKYDEEVLTNIEFEKFLGGEGTTLRNQVWQEVRAA